MTLPVFHDASSCCGGETATPDMEGLTRSRSDGRRNQFKGERDSPMKTSAWQSQPGAVEVHFHDGEVPDEDNDDSSTSSTESDVDPTKYSVELGSCPGRELGRYYHDSVSYYNSGAPTLNALVAAAVVAAASSSRIRSRSLGSLTGHPGTRRSAFRFTEPARRLAALSHGALSMDEGHQGPFCCHICHKGPFARLATLRKHSWIHSGERPHVCGVCNRGFSLKGNLKKHSRIHTGEKPFECVECDKRFLRFSDLKRHLRGKRHGGPGRIASMMGSEASSPRDTSPTCSPVRSPVHSPR